MRDDLTYRQLGKVLWDIGGVETGAAVACGLMVSTPFLTASERRFVRDRMWPEERGHDRMMARWGHTWYGPRPRRRMPYAATVWRDLITAAQLPATFRFACCFATVHWNEVNSLHSQRQILPILEAADPAAARDFRQIMGEESGHVAWGSGLRARLEQETPTLSRIVEHYFDLTDQVYRAVINRSQARIWQQLRGRLAMTVPPAV